MAKLSFYHIEERYVEYLHDVDRRVQYNKNERRPYVGVVLEIQGNQYYVPLESPRPEHEKIKGGGPVLKLDQGKLGLMGFNNMIPVRTEQLKEFDINALPDPKYQALLRKQLSYCRGISDVIYARAETTYRKAVAGKPQFYKKICCHFKKLESAAKKYQP